jgi:hypothetical protein
MMTVVVAELVLVESLGWESPSSRLEELVSDVVVRVVVEMVVVDRIVEVGVAPDDS